MNMNIAGHSEDSSVRCEESNSHEKGKSEYDARLIALISEE